MFNSKLKAELQQCQDQLLEQQGFFDAVHGSVATITFTPDGTVLAANDLFLNVVGFSAPEVIGQHHRIFCDKLYAQSSDYQQFWADLKLGRSRTGVFQRFNKRGEVIWLEATYFPVKLRGVVTKVIKIAADITEHHLQLLSQQAVVTALDRSLAVIEFTPGGEVIAANGNFLHTMGYTLAQVQGKHHRIFCDDHFYQENPHFWEELGRGQFKSGLFCRQNSHGSKVWLEATYNPILDDNRRVVKVIKFASEVTERIKRAQAVSEAANIAQTISQETTRFAETGSELLAASVAISSAISEQVSRTSGLIGQLNEQSKSIEAIVSTISSIAEQTNLLALNAAIEAARAGDQGRGFAVVADEVRQLAARTSLSTGEIASVVQKNRELTAQITGNINEVATSAQRGKEQIGEVSGVMAQIEQGAINVTETVSNLAIGS
ncbi:methyl-accepting chemotaxis protein [Aeromonas veronii]